jgi:hypothetical protein
MKYALVLMVLGLATAATPMAASASSPVNVTECRFPVYTADAFSGELTASRERSLWVTFRNTGDAQISEITFDAFKNGEHLSVIDKGHFRRGAVVSHQLSGYSTEAPNVDKSFESCTVTAVRFEDGTLRHLKRLD